jgi:transposase-like protein
MKLEVTVSEIADIFKEIQERPGQLFEMIRLDIREVVGKYLTAMMNAELTHYLGRDPYVRVSGAVNHRNGSYGRGFALKGVGEVNFPPEEWISFKLYFVYSMTRHTFTMAFLVCQEIFSQYVVSKVEIGGDSGSGGVGGLDLTS